MKKIISLFVAFCFVIALVGCGEKEVSNASEKDKKTEQPVETETNSEETKTEDLSLTTEQNELEIPIVDYEDEIEFEDALNQGLDPVGKTVSFYVSDISPDSMFGYNLYAGRHLNFCSDENPGAEVGDWVYVKITEYENVLGSHILYYDLLAVVDSENVDKVPPTIYDFDEMGDFIETSWTKCPYGIIITATNTSDYELDVEFEIIYKKNDSLVGTAEQSIYCLAGGESQICFANAFDEDYEILEFDDAIIQAVTSEPFYSDASSDLSYEVTSGEDRDTLVITNNGESDIDFGYIYAVYYKDNEIFYASEDPLGDIKAGKFTTENIYYPIEMECDFDKVEYTIYGYSWQ